MENNKNSKEQLNRDRIVCATCSEGVWQQPLCVSDLTLEKAILICLAQSPQKSPHCKSVCVLSQYIGFFQLSGDCFIKTHGSESQDQESKKQARKNKKHDHYSKSITWANIFVMWRHYYEWNLLPRGNFWICFSRMQFSCHYQSAHQSYKQINRLFSLVLLINFIFTFFDKCVLISLQHLCYQWVLKLDISISSLVKSYLLWKIIIIIIMMVMIASQKLFQKLFIMTLLWLLFPAVSMLCYLNITPLNSLAPKGFLLSSHAVDYQTPRHEIHVIDRGWTAID